MRKENNLKIIAVIVMIIFVLNGIIVVVSSYFDSRDTEWGIKMSVSDVTPTGLNLTIERNSSEKDGDLSCGHDYWIEKRTLFGWEKLDTKEPMVTYAIGRYIEENEPIELKANWERIYGRLWPGIYRIGKVSSTDDCYHHSEEEIEELHLEQTLYATFGVLF